MSDIREQIRAAQEELDHLPRARLYLHALLDELGREGEVDLEGVCQAAMFTLGAIRQAEGTTLLGIRPPTTDGVGK